MDNQRKASTRSSAAGFVQEDGIVFGLRPVKLNTIGDQDKHYAFLQRGSESDEEAKRKQRLYAAHTFCSTIPLRGTVEMELELVHDDDFNVCGLGRKMSVGVASCPRDVNGKTLVGQENVTKVMWQGGYELVTDQGKFRYGNVNLFHLRGGDRVGIQMESSGELVFSVNGKSQGVAAKQLYDSDRELYVLVDVNESDYALRIKRAGTYIYIILSFHTQCHAIDYP